MSPDPLVPDYIPDELLEQLDGVPLIRPRAPKKRPAARRPAQHLRPAPEVRSDAERVSRRARQREDAAFIVAIELGLFGIVAVALWWTSLASSSGSWLWTAFTYGGWLLALHLPALLAVVVLRVIERRGR